MRAPGNGLRPSSCKPLDLVLKEPQTEIERIVEALFLVQDDPGDVVPVLQELRVGVLHGMHDGDGDLIKERAIQPQEAPVAQRPANHPPQHVASPFVAGQDAVVR